ncbi:hypothetical protein COM11_25310 [Bacillus pseudomycoides]|nr:hypothetical protein COM11_25310 [Bacillus pseudomycoides]
MQGFPDEAIQQVCSKEQLCNQYGNVVTVNVIKAIAEKLV